MHEEIYFIILKRQKIVRLNLVIYYMTPASFIKYITRFSCIRAKCLYQDLYRLTSFIFFIPVKKILLKIILYYHIEK